MVKPTAEQRKRNRRYLYIGLAILAAIMMAGMFAINYTVQYEGDTRPMVSVADQLRPDPSWKLRDEQLEPPRIVCMDDVRCPSLHRVWKVGKNLTKDEFQAMLQRAGWNFPIGGDCMPLKSVGGTVTICEATGEVDEFKVSLSMDGSYDRPEDSLMILSIEKTE